MRILLALSLLLASNVVFSATSVCSTNSSEISRLHDAGFVITRRAYNGRCSSNIGYTFDTLSGTTEYVCKPSTANNVPSPYAITEFSGTYNSCTSSNISNGDGYKVQKLTSTSSTYTVCSYSPVPDGYVEIQTGITGGTPCNSQLGSTQQKKVKMPSTTPGTKTTICSGSSVPAGFVVTEVGKYSACKTSNTTSGPGKKITIPNPHSTTTVCGNATVPPGFAYFSVGNYSQCSSTGSAPGFKIGPVSGSSATICGNSDSHVPPGYVVTAVSSSSYCGNYKSLTIKKPSTSSTTKACQIQLGAPNVPSGFVVVAGQDNGCGTNYDSYNVKVPSGSSEFICSGSPVPSGWSITSQATSSACSGFAGNASAVIKPLGGDGPYNICKNQPIPDGFVINEITNVWTCGNGSWKIVRPSEVAGNKTTVCAMTAGSVPAGFVITDVDQYTNCSYPSGAKSGFRITKPYTNRTTHACHGSVVPDGFAIISSGTLSACGEGSASGPSIELGPLAGAGPFRICTHTAPAGYVVTAVGSSTVCTGGTAYTIQQPSSSGTFMCAGGNIPTGFVVTKIQASTACDTYTNTAWYIEHPSSNGQAILVCNLSPIPPGFALASYGARDSHSCAVSGAGAAKYIISLNDQAAVPTEFIRTESNVTQPPAAPPVLCDVSNTDGGLLQGAAYNPQGCR